MSSTQIKSYMIYNPVYRQIKKYIKRKTCHRNFIVNTWNICLYARDDILDMKLVWVRADSAELITFIDKLITASDRSLPWQKFPNIMVSLAHYDGLKDFIRLNKLWNYIDKIETKTSVAVIRSKMKVITFHPRILEKHILMLHKQVPYRNFAALYTNLYIDEAYDWLKPEALKHFSTKIRYQYSHVVIYLLLDYYRTRRRRRNIRVLNLLDLCSLRLAMFDPRYYQFDQCEISGLIHTELRDLIELEQKYDKHFIFDPTTYLIDNGVQNASHHLVEYFLFYVSSYKDTTQNIPEPDKFSHRIWVKNYVRLYTEKFYAAQLIDFIEKRLYLQLWIDGSDVAMNAGLILKIMSYPNVFKFSVDTNFSFALESIVSFQIDKFENILTVSFCGHNLYGSLENYLTNLNTFLKFRPFNLYIQCPVTDYTVFNQIPAHTVLFLRHDLTAKMISELHKTELTGTFYNWQYATLVNDPTILELLHEFSLVRRVAITQDENTFDLIFRFIEHQFRVRNLTEFNFNDSYIIQYDMSGTGVEGELKLNDYTFRLNEDRTKIEMFDSSTCKVVDLYDILYHTKSAEMDFDYYQ